MTTPLVNQLTVLVISFRLRWPEWSRTVFFWNKLRWRWVWWLRLIWCDHGLSFKFPVATIEHTNVQRARRTDVLTSQPSSRTSCLWINSISLSRVTPPPVACILVIILWSARERRRRVWLSGLQLVEWNSGYVSLFREEHVRILLCACAGDSSGLKVVGNNLAKWGNGVRSSSFAQWCSTLPVRNKCSCWQ